MQGVSIKEAFLRVLSFEPFWTILCGVLVFLICEYAKNTWFDALQQYKQMKYHISYLLCMHANKYTNPVDIAMYNDVLPQEYKDASEDFRETASKMRAFIEVLPFIHIGIPNKKKLYEASAQLVGLSNSFTLPYNASKNPAYRDREQDNEVRADSLRSLLKIYTK